MRSDQHEWRPLKSHILAASLAFALTGTAIAAEPEIPLLWDAKERLSKPDLATLPRLRFLTTTEFSPFNFLDASGRLSGFHVDLARAICAELAVMDRCQIQALPWSELAPALRKGDGEAIIAGLTVSAESRAQYAFSRPYLVFPARFVVANAKPVKEPLAETLRGARIGVVAASAHERMLRANFPQLNAVTFAKHDLMTADLKSGKLDAIFGDGMRLGFWMATADAANCCRFAGGPYLSQDFWATAYRSRLTRPIPNSPPRSTMRYRPSPPEAPSASFISATFRSVSSS